MSVWQLVRRNTFPHWNMSFKQFVNEFPQDFWHIIMRMNPNGFGDSLTLYVVKYSWGFDLLPNKLSCTFSAILPFSEWRLEVVWPHCGVFSIEVLLLWSEIPPNDIIWGSFSVQITSAGCLYFRGLSLRPPAPAELIRMTSSEPKDPSRLYHINWKTTCQVFQHRDGGRKFNTIHMKILPKLEPYEGSWKSVRLFLLNCHTVENNV